MVNFILGDLERIEELNMRYLIFSCIRSVTFVLHYQKAKGITERVEIFFQSTFISFIPLCFHPV